MPPCTRYWTTATVLTAVLTQCKIVNPLQLYYSFRAVYVRSQVSCPSLSTLLLYPREPPGQADSDAVLAPPDHIHLLRPSLLRSPLPPLLPATLLAPPRIQLRSQPCDLLMAPPLRLHLAPLPLLHPLLPRHPPLPRLRPLQHARLHLEPKEPGHATLVDGVAGLHGAISTLGAHGV